MNNVLPEEIFEEIFKYLELTDLLSCCLVCKNWRNVINSNRIWFNLCAQRSPVNKNNYELIQAPLFVDPAFISPSFTCTTLTNLCPWRLRFTQEAHLSRNWRFGRFVSYPVDRFQNPSNIECNDDVLLVLSAEKRDFSGYNINSIPELVQTSRFSMTHVSADFFKLSGDKLVVVQCTLMQVYTKTKCNNNLLELSKRCLFNRKEEQSSCIPDYPDISDWYNNNIGLYPSDINIHCDHNGEYFVGLVEEGNLNKSIIHIWDLNSGHKTAEQLVPEINDLVINISFSIHSSNLFIIIKLTDSIEEFTTIRCFSLNSFKYTNMNITFSYVLPVVLFSEKLILNMDSSGKTLFFWKTKDGSFIHKLSSDFNINPAALQFVSSWVIFAANSYSEFYGIVKVLNTTSLTMVCEFKTDYRVNHLLFIRSNLILVCGWMQLGVWDMATERKVHTLDFHDCIWISPNNTKTLVENDEELSVLHFW